MASEYTLKITAEQAREMPMVDLAFELLKSANTPFYYRDLMMEIAKIKGLSEQDVMQVIAQLYTEINIDGRFACVGSNLWGLKRWYPVEKSEDAVGNAKRPRIINDEDDDDEDIYAEEEEDTYAEEDEYDAFGGDSEEEAEEDSEFFEDEEIEEEELGDTELDESEEGLDEELEEDEEEGEFEDEDEEEDDK
ncbi:DNA-directed RNA polymerase subunit delta [Paenibacillus aestuarii]|uniref:Probable DNA-directed RNA polymerase subunit delta n=1 Tax=Paenibacillus aestuarii TaxID=516965 RepID=A0ABW0KD49_9BACL|nr:DNA-directed RNA polymerase subunit delta [Paenibacillus aestuarii]